MRFNTFCAAAASLCVVVISGCSPPPQRTQSQVLTAPFSITNVILEDGSKAWIVEATNGVSLEMEQQRLTVNVRIDNTITIWFDAKTRKILKILLETPNTENQPGQWVTDFNADGIPDSRRFKGKDQHEVFYRGQWYPSDPGGGKNVLVTINGKRTSLVFDGSEWKESSGSN